MKNSIDEKVVEAAAKMTMDRFSFDMPDMQMLVPDAESLETHITIQPAAVAYFGAMAKDAQRKLDDAKKNWKYRWMEMYGMVSRALCLADPKRKPTVTEIEAETYSRHRAEVDGREQEMAKLAQQADLTQSYYEGWQAKSFSLNHMVQLSVAGLYTKDSYETGSSDLGGQKPDLKTQAARLRQIAGGQ